MTETTWHVDYHRPEPDPEPPTEELAEYAEACARKAREGGGGW